MNEHLEELRKRLLISSIAVLVGAALGFAFHKPIISFLLEPAQGYIGAPDGKLVFTEMTEMLGTVMKVSLLSGLVMALPMVAYQAARFVAPGLTAREHKYLYLLPLGVIIAFTVGVLFGYFVLFPPGLKFLLTFDADIATPYIRIGNYINLVISLLFWMGLVFQLPIVMFLLARWRIVSASAFPRFRRYAFLLAFVLGAIITPTVDPINQTIVSLPILILYETGIWLARLAQRNPH
jgi:sec-independent protein translocase protein TatC